MIGYLFISISLMTSTAMIGLTTYTSIVERATEIGILKTLGAANNDITKTFMFELISVGLMSSMIAGILSIILIPILNTLLYDLLSIKNILKTQYIFLLIFGVISILFIVLVGLIPVLIHNKKQAIENIKFKL